MSNHLRYLPAKHTSVVAGVSTGGSHQGRRGTRLSGRGGSLAFNLTSATEGASRLMVLGIISLYKLKPPSQRDRMFFGKRFVYSPGGKYRKHSSRVFFHYGEELKKTSRRTLSFLSHPLNGSFLCSRYRAELERSGLCKWKSTSDPPHAEPQFAFLVLYVFNFLSQHEQTSGKMLSQQHTLLVGATSVEMEGQLVSKITNSNI